MKRRLFLSDHPITLVICSSLVLLFVMAGAALSLPHIVKGGLQEKGYRMEVLESNERRTVIDVSIDALREEEIFEESIRYQMLHFGEWGYILDVGKPQLPELSFMLAVPTRSDNRVEILDSSITEMEGYRIFPFQGMTTDENNPDRPFQIDPDTYGRSEWFPQSPCHITKPAIWRDLRVLSLKVNPVRYNPVTGNLQVYGHICIAIIHEDIDPGSSLDDREIHVTPAYDSVYRGLVVNYDMIEKGEPRPVQTGWKYVIISYDSFAEEPDLVDFADLKSLKGVPTRIVKLSTIGGDPTSIKDFITTEFNDGVEFILFVGDDEHIPIYDSGWYGDHWYACVAGGDNYADIALGRLSVKNGSELGHQLDKIVQYEFSPPLNDWLTRSVLVAHKEGAPGKYEGCKEEIRTFNYSIVDPVFDTCYGSKGATNQDVKNAINAGRGIVNYRGHGSYTNWSSWNKSGQSFSNSDVYDLQNGNMTPVVYNIACYNGGIDYGSDCLIEAWMKAEDGAVGNLGATRPSYTDANHGFDKQLYQATFHLGHYNVMQTINHAKNYMIDQYGSYGLDNARMYLWLGDPELDIHTAIPAEPSVSHPGIVFIGPSNFTVTVDAHGAPMEDALVCLYKEDDVYEYGRTDQTGEVTLSINPLVPGKMTVSVTGHNLLAYSVEVDVIVPEGPYVLYNDHIVDDDTGGDSWGNDDGEINPGEIIELPVEVKNLGVDAAPDVTGTLTTADPYATITDGYEIFGTIAAGDSTFCQEDFDIEIAADCPDRHKITFTLTLESGSDNWESSFSLSAKAARLLCDRLWYDDREYGNGDGIFDPGEAVEVYVEVRNDGSTGGTDIDGELFFPVPDPYVTVLQGVSEYPDIDAGQTALNSTPYVIHAAAGAPESYFFDIFASVYPAYGGGDEESFSLSVGTFGDDMESGAEEWTHASDQSGKDMWHLETSRNHTAGGQYSYKCGGSGTQKYDPWTVCYLMTPMVRIPSGAKLRFWHWMEAEKYNDVFAYDGGILEISTNGTDWTQLQTDMGYSHLIGHRLLWENPFPAFLPVWSGAFGWTKETVDLSQYVGQDVYFRFYFGSDDFALWGNLEGWYIDDVKIEVGGGGYIILTLDPASTILHPGDTLTIQARLQNTTQDSEWVKAWADVFVKNGPPIPDNPVAGPYSLILGPGADILRTVNHEIPFGVRLGTYTYRGTVEQQGGEELDTDEFDFDIVE